MQFEPRLLDVRIPSEPEGVVIVLHGGAQRREAMMVSPTQLSVLRMIPIARRVARGGQGRLAVFRLLNSRRGWETSHTPVHDVQWALGELSGRFGRRVPVCLVGHSLGGRAALLAAGASEVVGAAALAPWVLPSDAPGHIDGKPFLIVHGSRDRIARPDRALAVAQRLRSRAPTDFVLVEGAHHAMLRRHDVFSGLAADFAAHVLLGEPGLELSAGADGIVRV